MGRTQGGCIRRVETRGSNVLPKCCVSAGAFGRGQVMGGGAHERMSALREETRALCHPCHVPCAHTARWSQPPTGKAVLNGHLSRRRPASPAARPRWLSCLQQLEWTQTQLKGFSFNHQGEFTSRKHPAKSKPADSRPAVTRTGTRRRSHEQPEPPAPAPSFPEQDSSLGACVRPAASRGSDPCLPWPGPSSARCWR